MYHAERERACGRLFSFLAGLIAFSQFYTGAATLTFSGVAEDSQIILPPSLLATNLSITAVISGGAGAPQLAWALECQGAFLQKFTSSAPHAATFSNLFAGKYFLAGTVVGETNVSADLSFDIRSAWLRPPNDSWNQGLSIASLGVAVTGTNAFATSEPGEPMHADNGGGRSVWWKWTAATDGVVSITTEGSGFDTVLAVYTGTNVGSLKQIAANDDAGGTNRWSQVTFTAVAGTTYDIAVDGAVLSDGSVATGAVQWQLLALASPVVDLSSPTNGQSFFVPATLTPTNLEASASISDPAGLRRVEYSLDGAGSQTGLLSAPYQFILSNLLAGDYLLTVTAVNSAGLIRAQHTGFSIVPLAPKILFVDSKPADVSGFRFAITGLKGMNYELQAATNMPSWSRLTLWTNFDGAQRVTDTDAANLNARFYRVIAP